MATNTREKRRPYLPVFGALAVLTAVEVGVASLGLEQGIRIFLLLSLAAVKASLVALFYMHLRYDHRILAVIGGFPLLLVVFLLLILMVDRPG
ncbi:MAG: cytochrome C oxidase subunit IV family protein [Chloroflexota bacterium]